ncbi:MAG: bifunctional homocysteine S-methyltransferase/methylenetetrahydrofolate reductase [Anaerolineae bacterium]|nr:bifunctional homocysteine S-methyltransferase/methylenetetrahydrofolate reductase [Anaerolineae bacterium]
MSKLSFRDRLAEGPLLADGAMGTYLHSRGVPPEACFDVLNLNDPALIFEVHHAYLDAGAELIETNTFGANRFKLADHGLLSQIADINRAGVEIARKAIEAAFKANRYVAASIGPLGVRLAPFGRVTTQQAQDAFREQISALVDANPDVLIFETFHDLLEIETAILAAREITDLPVIAQVTFSRDDRTLLGNTPGQVAETLAGLGVNVIGVNCSNGPAQAMRVVKAMQVALPGDSPVAFSSMPNAGWPEHVGGRVMYASGPDYFADYSAAFRDQGVSIIGGCCGTTPEHIAAMRAALDNPDYVSTIQSQGGPTAEPVEVVTSISVPSALARKLAAREFVVAVEVSPPRSAVPDKLLRAAQMLRESGADVIDVTDSPMARMRMSPWAACHLLERDAGVETVLHFPTRGRNLLRVQGDLLAAHALGIRNLFVVMGDPTRIGDYPEAADNYDIVPSGLVRLVKQSLNEGLDCAGNRIGPPTSFLVSCALNLNAPDPEQEIRVLRKKLDSGADYLLTQPVFDLDSLDRFMEHYESLYGPLETPVLIGVMPLYSPRHARFLHNEVPGITIPDTIMKRIDSAGEEAPQAGVEIAKELVGQIRDKAAGIYLMPQFSRYDLAAEIIEFIRGL